MTVGDRTVPSGQGPALPPIGLLVSFGMIGSLTIHMIVPALPGFPAYFDTDYATAQLLVSLFIVAFGAAQILVGPLADWFGRRRVLLFGLSAFAFTSALCPLAPNIETLIGLRMLQGVSACAGIVLARAIVRDMFAEDSAARMLGYLAMGVAVGPMVAPVLGGMVYEFAGWQSIFWGLSGFGFFLLLLAFLFVPETFQGAGRPAFGAIFRDFGALLSNRAFLLHGANICFNTGMFYAFVIGAPYVATQLAGMSPTVYGSWFALIAVGYALGNFTSGRLGYRYRRDTIILGGSFLCVFFVALIPAVFASGHISMPFLFVAMAGATFASGLIMPNSLAGVLGADTSKVGSASGFIGFVQFAFAAVFSSVTGFLLEGSGSAMPLLMVMCASALAGTVSALILWRRPA